MSYNTNMKQFSGIQLAAMVLISLVLPSRVLAQLQFRSGEILEARNITTGQSGWAKTIEANNLDEIEFKVIVENIGTVESSDVNVRAGFALDPGNNLRNRIFVGVWSAPQATGNVEIKVEDEAAQKLTYIAGKSVKYGGGCDGCSVSDDIAKSLGAYVGKVKPGEKIDVRFRAQVTDRQIVIKPTTSPTPTPKTDGATGSAIVKTTPKTGFIDPLWTRTMFWMGLGVSGFGLRQIASKMGRIEV